VVHVVDPAGGKSNSSLQVEAGFLSKYVTAVRMTSVDPENHSKVKNFIFISDGCFRFIQYAIGLHRSEFFLILPALRKLLCTVPLVQSLLV
jgi:hypothetical protein